MYIYIFTYLYIYTKIHIYTHTGASKGAASSKPKISLAEQRMKELAGKAMGGGGGSSGGSGGAKVSGGGGGGKAGFFGNNTTSTKNKKKEATKEDDDEGEEEVKKVEVKIDTGFKFDFEAKKKPGADKGSAFATVYIHTCRYVCGICVMENPLPSFALL